MPAVGDAGRCAVVPSGNVTAPVPGNIGSVATEIVTAPVPDETLIAEPATALVTPVLDNVTVPPNATGLPDTPNPVPPVTVMVLFVNAELGIAVKFVPVNVGDVE